MARTAHHLVINAINLSVGGGRTVLREFLYALHATNDENFTTTCFVRRTDDLPTDGRIAYIIPELPKNNWVARLWFEFVGLSRAVAGQKVDTFVSLQGSGAHIAAERRFIYCHNALPLASIPPGVLDGARQLQLMRRIYDLLYRFTIRRSDWLIVQQQWVRDAFRSRYGPRQAIVAHPVRAGSDRALSSASGPLRTRKTAPFRLLYPLAAHPYKNAEVACEAIVRLEAAFPGQFELILTISGADTPYAGDLSARYGKCPGVRLVGQLSREELTALYRDVDLLVFPSLVETWGLPISEAKATGLPILAADLPYAHETVGRYAQAGFFDPFDAVALSEAIRGCWSGERPLGAVSEPLPAEPFAPDWEALIGFILAGGARIGSIAGNDTSSLDRNHV